MEKKNFHTDVLFDSSNEVNGRLLGLSAVYSCFFSSIKKHEQGQ